MFTSLFLPALENEYKFWMDGASKLKAGQAYRRVVKMKDGTILNRYWDDSNVPRQESWKEDFETAARSKRNKIEMYKHLRAGAESGIDFSNRWFADGKNITSIQTTNYIAVDLNALLINLEYAISKGYQAGGKDSLANDYRKKAEKRRVAIDKYCWNSKLNYYCDYNFKTQKILNEVTPQACIHFVFLKVSRLPEPPGKKSL
jgi:alpha,alpha-trehalase